jgi:hypothetical protein
MHYNQPTFVDFIIPTYNRYDQLKSMLYSLIAQYDSDWSAQVIIDDITNNIIIDNIKDINDSRISYTLTGQRYNDWGHTPREIGKQQSTSQYVIMTGDDNYYVPTLVGELKKVAESNSLPALIYWNMIHNYWDYESRPSALHVGCIDMGAFATRCDLAQQIKLPTSYCADAEFIVLLRDFLANTNKNNDYVESEKFVHINKILFVHN